MTHFCAQRNIIWATTSGHQQRETKTERLWICREVGRMSLLHIICVQTQHAHRVWGKQFFPYLRYQIVDLLNLRDGSNLREYVVKHLHFQDKNDKPVITQKQSRGWKLGL